MGKVKMKVKKKAKAKATKKAANKVVVNVAAMCPVETLEGAIKKVDAAGLTVQRRRPRSSKEELLFIPSTEVVAYAKGGGKKGADLIVRRVAATTLLNGKVDAFKPGDKPEVTIEGVKWVLNPNLCTIQIAEEL